MHDHYSTGCSCVHIFDHTIRRNAPGPRTADGPRGPIQRVHVDQSRNGSIQRVRHHFPNDANKLLSGRVQIINAWRPLSKVLRDPLALADSGTVPDSDLILTQFIYPDRVGETYEVRWGAGHRWYYKYGMVPEEVMLFKCYDSETDGRATRTPHSAFEDPLSSSQDPVRESIEVRALIFHRDV